MQHEHHSPSINAALAELEGIKNRLYAAGAFDVEPSQLETIRRQLMSGTLSPEKALTAANNIIEGRSEYH